MLVVDTPLGPFAVHPRGSITTALQEGRWWDAHLKPILDEAPPGLAVDIGAHFGWFTVYLAQRHCHVVAVEPNPSSFQLLLHNVARRPGLEHRIQCWPVAAYDQVATLEWAPQNDTTDAATCGFTPIAHVPDRPDPFAVPAVLLDLYLPSQPRVTVVKCDAQGADLCALQGLRRTLARDRPLVVFEWEAGMAAWQGHHWVDVLAFFEALRYRVTQISPDYMDYVARPD